MMMKYGAIAGGEKSIVQTAFEILKNGGNVFDAAVGVSVLANWMKLVV
tara:strand:- start:969 stop:1112 length:144 start_codon:yes stop_codon:yes gene_type:complete